ncbi:hypothetical protein CPC08DRAFT_724022 [Agrocybe pediades]|nr:hypothetical protein CPC08DRAFT_724022 [Agrocybe pediades]
MKTTLKLSILLSVLHTQHVLSTPVEHDSRDITVRAPIEVPPQLGQVITLSNELIPDVKSMRRLAAGPAPSPTSTSAAPDASITITARSSNILPDIGGMETAEEQVFNGFMQGVQSLVRPIKSLATAPFAFLFPGAGSGSASQPSTGAAGGTPSAPPTSPPGSSVVPPAQSSANSASSAATSAAAANTSAA